MPHTQERNGITLFAAGCIVAAMAAFNVAGWVLTWIDSWALLGLFASLAVASEVLAFNMAIAVERAVRNHRKPAAWACGYVLVVCMAINAVSGHNAWAEFERAMFAPETRAAQVEIDERRGALLTQIAEIDRQIAAARPPVAMSAGPQGRAEARRVYEIELARLQPMRAIAQQRLDQEPLTAPQRRIAPDWLVWLVFGAIQIMTALVLWAIGAGQAAAASAHAETAAHPQPATETQGETQAESSVSIDPKIAKEIEVLQAKSARWAAVWRHKYVHARSVRQTAARLKVDRNVVDRALRSARKYLDKLTPPPGRSPEEVASLQASGVAVIRVA